MTSNSIQLRLRSIQAHLKSTESDYNRRAGQFDLLEVQRDRLEETLNGARADRMQLEKVRILLQKVGNDARETARVRLEETVTDALKFVFGPDFSFEIELNQTRGKVEAEFYVSSEYNGKVVRTRPENARGGGVVDIISIALRVALLMIHNNPTIKGPIILDEPGKHVSADYTIKLAQFMKHISEKFNRQIIISTHQQDLASIADKQITVELKGGKSVVS